MRPAEEVLLIMLGVWAFIGWAWPPLKKWWDNGGDHAKKP